MVKAAGDGWIGRVPLRGCISGSGFFSFLEEQDAHQSEKPDLDQHQCQNGSGSASKGRGWSVDPWS
jgi:hypothetical protein